MFSTPSPSTGSGGSPIFPSPTKTQYKGLTGEELGTEMVASDLMKLSKQKGVSFSGKREHAETYKYVLENKLYTAFGDVAARLLCMNGTNGYTLEEWINMKEWQRAYVLGMDRGMRDDVLTSIKQEEPTDLTLMHNKPMILPMDLTVC